MSTTRFISQSWCVLHELFTHCDFHTTIKTGWVGTNKGDSANPLTRSRLVAKEFRISQEETLFAGTLPLESLRYLLSRAATLKWKTDRPKSLHVLDVKRAHFYAPAQRRIFV